MNPTRAKQHGNFLFFLMRGRRTRTHTHTHTHSCSVVRISPFNQNRAGEREGGGHLLSHGPSSSSSLLTQASPINEMLKTYFCKGGSSSKVSPLSPPKKMYKMGIFLSFFFWERMLVAFISLKVWKPTRNHEIA